MAIEYNRGSVTSPTFRQIDSASREVIETPSGRVDQSTGNPVDSTVTTLILSSSIYREAEQVLSKDREYGTSYLTMLRMIPYSHEIRDANFWDAFVDTLGGTSGYDKAVTDAFNAAMDEIRSLMQDYYSFLSKLPVEQVEQLRDAGINASITGEGVSPSSMTSPDPSAMISPNPSQTEYSNTSLSQGVTSFVEFINSMANLRSVGVNSKNILGLLDLAEREGYNKQETHDLLLAGLGVTTDSPYRVLNTDNTPAVSTISSTAQSEQRVKSAEASASAKALDMPVSVTLGTDPEDIATYEIKSGEDWLSEISRFQIANRFGNVMIQNLRTQSQQRYADVLSRLEGEYQMANFQAQTNEAQFNSEYFIARDGATEGQNQTDLSTSLAAIKQAEADIQSVEAWLSEYRAGIIEHWGKELEKRPNLAPYFYKAMFDFGMEDTFYHQNGAAMGLKYGMQSLQSIGSFIGSLTGFKKPPLQPRKVGQTTTTTGPQGTTTTETVFNYE